VLVLSRRIGESIVVGPSAENVTITVLEVRGDVVRIGIDAPRSVGVHRAELLAELADANTEAASPSAEAVASLSEAVASLSEALKQRP
jgi:carbon storage regulator